MKIEGWVFKRREPEKNSYLHMLVECKHGITEPSILLTGEDAERYRADQHECRVLRKRDKEIEAGRALLRECAAELNSYSRWYEKFSEEAGRKDYITGLDSLYRRIQSTLDGGEGERDE